MLSGCTRELKLCLYMCRRGWFLCTVGCSVFGGEGGDGKPDLSVLPPVQNVDMGWGDIERSQEGLVA